MSTQSAGILMYRRRPHGVEVLLVHPGGPFWARKDAGAWSIPKGEFDPRTEDGRTAAVREFAEETGHAVAGTLVPLPPTRQRSGKVVHAWSVESDWDPSSLASNTFVLEWPRGSGRVAEFPEVDRAEWFDLAAALAKINPGQAELIRALASQLQVVIPDR
jgi:predicted NUDIX family NTP pyrophosphohydrolase